MSDLHVLCKIADVEYVLPADDVLQMESFAGATNDRFADVAASLTAAISVTAPGGVESFWFCARTRTR